MVNSNIGILYLNFINKKTYRILELLRENTPIKSVRLRNFICKKDNLMTEGTYYRHIKNLIAGKLISRSGKMIKGGREYELSDLGLFIFKMLEKTKIKVLKEIEKETKSLEEYFENMDDITKIALKKLGFFDLD